MTGRRWEWSKWGEVPEWAREGFEELSFFYDEKVATAADEGPTGELTYSLFYPSEDVYSSFGDPVLYTIEETSLTDPEARIKQQLWELLKAGKLWRGFAGDRPHTPLRLDEAGEKGAERGEKEPMSKPLTDDEIGELRELVLCTRYQSGPTPAEVVRNVRRALDELEQLRAVRVEATSEEK